MSHVATMYNSSSRGPIPIEGMTFPETKNAHAALLRRDPSRTAEIAGLAARLQTLGAEYEAKLRAEHLTADLERKIAIEAELTRLEAERAGG